MTTKLYGKDLKEYDEIDVDTLLTKLSLDELEELNKDIDPDVDMFSSLTLSFRYLWNALKLELLTAAWSTVQGPNIQRPNRSLQQGTVADLSGRGGQKRKRLGRARSL